MVWDVGGAGTALRAGPRARSREPALVVTRHQHRYHGRGGPVRSRAAADPGRAATGPRCPLRLSQRSHPLHTTGGLVGRPVFDRERHGSSGHGHSAPAGAIGYARRRAVDSHAYSSRGFAPSLRAAPRPDSTGAELSLTLRRFALAWRFSNSRSAALSSGRARRKLRRFYRSASESNSRWRPIGAFSGTWTISKRFFILPKR